MPSTSLLLQIPCEIQTVFLPTTLQDFQRLLHTPPSVVLLWIHLEKGEAPTSLLQETLMLYNVMDWSPETSHSNGGTVTLMNLVVITSPFRRLTSLT